MLFSYSFILCIDCFIVFVHVYSLLMHFPVCLLIHLFMVSYVFFLLKLIENDSKRVILFLMLMLILTIDCKIAFLYLLFTYLEPFFSFPIVYGNSLTQHAFSI